MKKPMTIEALKVKYPPKEDSKCVTGYIPMEVFDKYEKEIRADIRKNHCHAFYRGRKKIDGKFVPTEGTTRRERATHVVIYAKDAS